MANSGRKDDNGSQFFLTLGDTKELSGKNTLFGKIVGDTIYNLVRMGELELEEGTERPMFPPKVLGTEVLVNPFEDVKPRETKRKAEVSEKPEKKAAAGKKKKGGKALLSFMGDEEDGMAAPIKKKPKFDTRLVVDAPVMTEEKAPEKKETPANQESKPPPKQESKPRQKPRSRTPTPQPTSPPSKPTPSRSPTRSPTPPPSKSSTLLAKTNAQIAALKRSLRRSASPPPAPPPQKKHSLLALQKSMLPPTSVQGRKRRRATEDDTAYLALQRFREKLASAPSPPPFSSHSPRPDDNKEIVAEEDAEASLCDLHFIPNCQSCSNWDRTEREGEEEGEGGEVTGDLWGHALSFEKDRLGKDLNWKKKNEELVVIDPREKQKEILGKRRGGGRGDGGERRENNRRREQRGR